MMGKLRTYFSAGSLAAVALLAACSGGSLNSTPKTTTASSQADGGLRQVLWHHAIPIYTPSPAPSTAVCTGPGVAGGVLCNAVKRTNVPSVYPDSPLVTASSLPGYHPADLQSAYALPSTTAGTGQKIALIVAHDDPTAELDLAVYRNKFGLPACTTANGCFKKVNMHGQAGGYPGKDDNWSLEASIDLDMASAICPHCKLLLVESDNDDPQHLAQSVDEAVALGATVVSNSYSTDEDPNEPQLESHYNHPGVPIVAGAGDSGFGVSWPAASKYVIAVAGTSLLADTSSSRGWGELAWSMTGSGCSRYVSKPSWQTDAGCTTRTVADVAAEADPNPGVTVYDGEALPHSGGWEVVGGTSVATPIVAGVYALAGNGSIASSPQYLYQHASLLNPVLGGSNGSCNGSYLCNVTPAAYSGPGGNGTPNGIAAF